jgi:hypothetical protein
MKNPVNVFYIIVDESSWVQQLFRIHIPADRNHNHHRVIQTLNERNVAWSR